MLESLEDDITRGSLLYLEKKSKLYNFDGKRFKSFPSGEYCIYLGYSRKIHMHLLLCGNEIFHINSFNLLSKTYIL